MNIETRYDPGDVVWHVSDRMELRFDPCGKCNASGKVAALMPGESVLVDCPRCRGRGEQPSEEKFLNPTVKGPLTLGQVRVKINPETEGALGYRHYDVGMHSHGPQPARREETYMAVETGIDSGSIYHAHDLFPSPQAAHDEAESRRIGSLQVHDIAKEEED